MNQTNNTQILDEAARQVYKFLQEYFPEIEFILGVAIPTNSEIIISGSSGICPRCFGDELTRWMDKNNIQHNQQDLEKFKADVTKSN